jgi:hypothetical protein
MLNGDDKKTFYALRILRDVVDKKERPIIIWIGAGASRWCGYPTWKETAQQFLKNFRRYEHSFDKHKAEALFREEKFPELFELFKCTGPHRYKREMVSTFGARTTTPVYTRFLNEVRAISPIKIITTNIDETLEHNLTANSVQRSDLEQCLNLLGPDQTFIAKIHGSISSLESSIFTSTEYSELLANPGYLKTLQFLFAQATVVFVGYSLRDKYVLDLFAGASGFKPLFGDGPHFLVCTDEFQDLPESVQTIRYTLDPYADHRSAITVLDIIRVVRNGGHVWFSPENESPVQMQELKSSYYISDIVPPGVWATTMSLELSRPDGLRPRDAILGQGFDDSELPDKTPVAMHDITVGLISFDQIYIPLGCAGRLHQLIGPSLFSDLVNSKTVCFVYFEREPMVIFRSIDDVQGGDLGEVHKSTEEGKPLTIDDQMRGMFKAIPGHETEIEQLFVSIRAATITFDHTRFHIPNLTRGALLHPSVQRLLGLSDAVVPSSFPRWARFPVLRLAHTIQSGCACQSFAIPATKISFGSEILVGAAFAVSAARDWADTVSSYVLTSRFNTDLGHYIQSNPKVLEAILKFRDTQEGFNLRKEILAELATNSGGDFVASVNAGLKRFLPTQVMEAAHDQLSSLLFKNQPESAVIPAVWTNTRNSDLIAKLWRKRCRKELEDYCRKWGFRDASACPCGSGEKLRLCCALALRN